MNNNIQDGDEDNKQIVSHQNGGRQDDSVVVVPKKKVRVSQTTAMSNHENNGNGLCNLRTPTNINNLKSSVNVNTSNGHTPSRTVPNTPKILTARKRTKNGVLKAPTELWLV